MDFTDLPNWLQAISAVVGLLVAAAAVLIALNQTRIAREQVRISAELNDLSRTQAEFSESQVRVNEEQLKISQRLEEIEARRDRPLPIPSKLTVYPRPDGMFDLDLHLLNAGGGAVVDMRVKTMSAVIHAPPRPPQHVWVIEPGRGLVVGTFVESHSETLPGVSWPDFPVASITSLLPARMDAEFVDALSGQRLGLSWNATSGFDVRPLDAGDFGEATKPAHD